MTSAVTLQTLTSGHVMPSVGLGVWRAEPNLLDELVRQAVKLGYRHFDCAGKPSCIIHMPHLMRLWTSI